MTVSAAKPEEKRLGWFVPTAVDQAESCVKPAAEGRTLARMPNPQHSETERLDHGPNWLKHTEDGLLLGECRLILVSHMEFLKLDTKVIRNFDNALAGEVEILATSTFSVLKGVVARIGCQVLTQALSVTRDMSGLCTR